MNRPLDVLSKLTFAASSAPTCYLNKDLAEQLFTSQLGAIDNFVQKRLREVKGVGKLPVIEIGASQNYALEATWDLAAPLTRALVLHSAMGIDRPLRIESSSPRFSFGEVISRIFLPDIPGLGDRSDPPMGWESVQDEARRQLEVVRAFGDSESVFWPLMFVEGPQPVACVADRKWFDVGVAASYFRADARVVAFGVVENIVDGLPFLTLIYLRAF